MYKKFLQISETLGSKFKGSTYSQSYNSSFKVGQPVWCASEVTAGSGGIYTENISNANRHSLAAKK